MWEVLLFLWNNTVEHAGDRTKIFVTTEMFGDFYSLLELIWRKNKNQDTYIRIKSNAGLFMVTKYLNGFGEN